MWLEIVIRSTVRHLRNSTGQHWRNISSKRLQTPARSDRVLLRYEQEALSE